MKKMVEKRVSPVGWEALLFSSGSVTCFVETTCISLVKLVGVYGLQLHVQRIWLVYQTESTVKGRIHHAKLKQMLLLLR